MPASRWMQAAVSTWLNPQPSVAPAAAIAAPLRQLRASGRAKSPVPKRPRASMRPRARLPKPAAHTLQKGAIPQKVPLLRALIVRLRASAAPTRALPRRSKSELSPITHLCFDSFYMQAIDRMTPHAEMQYPHREGTPYLGSGSPLEAIGWTKYSRCSP